jgi:hypothetical protein
LEAPVFRFLFCTFPVILFASALMAQDTSDSNSASSYDGPNIMGRGQVQVGRVGADPVPIRFSFNAAGTYDTLLGALRVGPDGNLAPAAGSYGVQGGFEVAGQKASRRSVLGLSFSGNYNHFPSLPGFSGFNQALTLAYARRVSRNLEMNWTNTASSTNRLLGNPLGLQSNGADPVSAPLSELFDTRIYFVNSQMSLAYRLNSRWQIVGGGNGGVVRRQNRALAGVNIYGGDSGLLYRVNRRTSIGVNYRFSHFNFGRSFGESNIHGVTVTVARQIGRDWQVSASGSQSSVHTVGTRRVSLDPVIAALLGRSGGVEAFDSRQWVAGYSFSVSRRYRRSTFRGTAERAVVPGNGFLLTSLNSIYGASADYAFARNWNVNSSIGRNMMSEIAGSGNSFDSWQAQVGVTRNLTTEISMNGSVEYRQFELSTQTLNRSGYRFTLGLSFSPTSLPFGR